MDDAGSPPWVGGRGTEARDSFVPLCRCVCASGKRTQAGSPAAAAPERRRANNEASPGGF
jgi:hypothetical protein